MAKEYLMGDLAWPDAESAAAAHKIVLIPLGSLEQHGPHLPLDTDTVTAFEFCKRVAEELPDMVVVLPPVYYTPAEVSMGFSGTVDIRPTVFIEYIYDICVSMINHGFQRIIMVSGHGLNPPFMNIVSQMVTNRHDAICAGVAYFDFAREKTKKIVAHGSHACEFETSILLALKPESVKMSKARREWNVYMGIDDSKYVWRNVLDRSPIFFIDRLDRFSETGIMGDPTKATKEKGRKLIEVIVEDMVGFVKEFQTRPVGRPSKHKPARPR